MKYLIENLFFQEYVITSPRVGGGSVSLRAWRDKIGGYLFYMSSSELVGGFLYKV